MTSVTMNVDRMLRVSPAAMEQIVLGRKTEVRSPIRPDPIPSDSPGGCGWVWYPDPLTKSHYVWNDSLDGLLRHMAEEYSPYGKEGQTVGMVVDWALGSLGESEPGEPPTIACKAKVLRSWAHRLDQISYDSVVRMGYETKVGLSYAGLDPDSDIDVLERECEAYSRMFDDMVKFHGADRVRPETFVWACEFEVEATRP